MRIPSTAKRVVKGLLPMFSNYPEDAWTDTRYEAWFRAHRTPAEEVERQRSVCFDYEPLFSIIVPLYKTPLDFLSDMAESVLAQSYGKLELVLVNASPELPELAVAVEELAARDGRVRVVTLEGNRGITENTNEGLAVARGEFCAFCDHDDWIEPDLLYEYVAALNENPEIDLLYCDEDLVDSRGHHLHPLFKPDYSPCLLWSKNYIVHLMTIRRSIIDEMPRPGAEFDGAQDYNMVLFASERARAIHHTPKVHYHWRVSSGSTAANPAAKPYSRQAYRKSIFAHYGRIGLPASVNYCGIVNIYNPWFRVPRDEEPLVSVIVRRTAGCAVTESFLHAWRQINDYANYELVLVGAEGAGGEGGECDSRECTVGACGDNAHSGSAHSECAHVMLGLAEQFSDLPIVEVSAAKNANSDLGSNGGAGNGGAVAKSIAEASPKATRAKQNGSTRAGGSPFVAFNAGAAQAKGDILIFLDDTSIPLTAQPVQQLIGPLASAQVAVSSPKTLYTDYSVRTFGVAVTSERIMPLYRGYPEEHPSYQCNTRASQCASATSYVGLTVARADFERVGGFDEAFEGEIGTADFCVRVCVAEKLAAEEKRHVETKAGAGSITAGQEDGTGAAGDMLDAACASTVEQAACFDTYACGSKRFTCVLSHVKVLSSEPIPQKPLNNKRNAPEYTTADLACFDAKHPGLRTAGDSLFSPNLDQASCYCQVQGR